MKSRKLLWLTALSAIVLAFGISARTTEAAPSGDAIRGDVPVSGVALGLLTVDLPPADVVTSLAIRGCNARTLGVVRDGALRTYVAGAPSFVNEGFPSSLTAGTPIIYVCDGTPPVIPATVPSPTPSPSPTASATPRAQLTFAPSISATDRATATTQIKALEDYWQREVGLTFEGLRVVIAQDFESELADTYATATQRTRAEAIANFNATRWVAVAIPRAAPDGKPVVLSITKSWSTSPDERSAIWVIAHEYYHLVQDRLSVSRISEAPLWVVEGSADYAAYRYIDSLTGNTTPLTTRLRPAASLSTAPISTLDRNCDEARQRAEGCNPLDPYRVGSFAHAWLAERTSTRAPSDFWRKMWTASTWETNFLATYGMSTADFYRDFEAFRAQSTPVLRGKITVNGGTPGTGWRLFICRSDGPVGQSCPGVVIPTNGQFQMAIATATSYRILYEDPNCNRGGYLAQAADTIVVTLTQARNVALGVTAVTLPDINFAGNCVTSTGRIEDSTGRGLADVALDVCFTDRCVPTKTSATGAYTINTPEGSALITVLSGKCAGWYYHPSGATRFGSQALRFTLTAAAPPAPITFRIPATADATCLA